MASNYQNSAGTDLDNLFYIDNKNAGAIGFQIPDGQDLGNRYSAASTLGYALGYQNSAGTDIGFLRGKLVAPSNPSISLTRPKYDRNGGYSYEDYEETTDSEGSVTGGHWVTKSVTGARIYFNLAITANTPIETIKVDYRITQSYVRSDGKNYWKFYDNHDLVAMTGTGSYPNNADGAFNDGYAGVFKTLNYSNINSNAWNHNFGLVCIPYGWYHCYFGLRCDCVLTNAAGSTTAFSNVYAVYFDQMT